MSDKTRKFPRGPANDAILGEFIDRDTLRFVRDFPHPATLVWEALTDREQVTKWLWPCTLFEAREGGRYSFEDSGMKWGGTISVFEPPTRLELDIGLFEIFEENGGSRLILTLKRPRSGWSPMTLAGFMGWLGRLTRLIEKAPQVEVERFASDIWEAMWPAYERLLRHHVTDGAKAIYRLHFAPGDPTLGPEAKSHLDVLSVLLHERSDLAVVIDGYGDDPCSTEDSIKLSAKRVHAAAKYLEQTASSRKGSCMASRSATIIISYPATPKPAAPSIGGSSSDRPIDRSNHAKFDCLLWVESGHSFAMPMTRNLDSDLGPE